MTNMTWCLVCRERQVPPYRDRFHYHTSLYRLQDKLLRRNIDVMDCPVCKHRHPINRGRVPVLFTSSTLHNVFVDPSVRVPFHLDIESQPGARTVDLWRIWNQSYGLRHEASDTVAVCGLNDVPFLTPNRFRTVLDGWLHDVKAANPDNTFRICKLLRPPKYAWFQGTPPTPDYDNYLDRINAYNDIIGEFNWENGFDNVIGFSHEGCRGGRKRRSGGRSQPQHQFSSWREVSQGHEHCLHLNDQSRAVMFRKLCTYIKHNIIKEY